MANYQINAEVRQGTGKGVARRLRRENLVPGNVYGKADANLLVSVKLGELNKAVQTGANLIDLKLGEETRIVIIKELQYEPVKGRIEHVDFYEVDMDQPVETVVPVVITGEENRESDGGIVNQVLREVTVSCLPANIPDAISANVTELVIGDTVTVADLEVPEGVTLVTAEDEVVVTITAPQAEAVEEAAEVAADEDAAEEAEEPEVAEE